VAKAKCVTESGSGSVSSSHSIVEALDGAHEDRVTQPEPTSDLSKIFGTHVNLDANIKSVEEQE
jgi:hypothetical protein